MAGVSVADLAAGAKGLLDEWVERAACAGRARIMDPPLDERSKSLRGQALAICRACPVLYDCRAWALGLPATVTPGWVVGGLTEEEIAQWHITEGQVPEGYKRCTRCRQIRALAEFHFQPQGLTRTRSACGRCRRTERRESRRAEAARTAQAP